MIEVLRKMQGKLGASGWTRVDMPAGYLTDGRTVMVKQMGAAHGGNKQGNSNINSQTGM